MKKLNLITPIPPSVNHYMKYRVIRGRKPFVQSYPSPDTINYQKHVIPYIKEQMKLQNWTPLEKDEFAFVYITFYFDRKRKDSNNYLKVPFDVFTASGVWYDDDKALPIVERVYIDRENPRAEFTIVKAGFKGIFKNRAEYKEFVKNNCERCSRNTNKCGILKKLFGNEIIPEANNKICKNIKNIKLQ